LRLAAIKAVPKLTLKAATTRGAWRSVMSDRLVAAATSVHRASADAGFTLAYLASFVRCRWPRLSAKTSASQPGELWDRHRAARRRRPSKSASAPP